MILVFPILAGLLLAQASATSVTLTEFDRYCSTLDGASAMEKRLNAGGWTRFKPDTTTEVGRLVAAINQVPSRDFKVVSSVFRSPGNASMILVSHMRAPDGSGSIECKHINEAGPIPTSAALSDWTGRTPEEAIKEGALTWAWKPGRGNAHLTAVVYVDPASKPRFPGVGVIVTSVRFH